MKPFPTLTQGQFAVLMADGATGHVLTNSGVVAINDSDEVLKVFESLPAAEDYVAFKANENDSWEFDVFDHLETFVKFYEAKRWAKSDL